jgi:hypothetical protein
VGTAARLLGHSPEVMLRAFGPAGPLSDSVMDERWCGHTWAPWCSLDEIQRAIRPSSLGLYRIRSDRDRALLYVGEGKVHGRIRAHHDKTGVPNHPQGQLFTEAQPLLCSWVLNSEWERHQRLELKNDLIAAHITSTGRIPGAQFQG